MVFRVTAFQLQNQALRFTAQHNANIFQLQQQLTSGLKFTRPSQAPLAFRQVASIGNKFGQLQVELGTITSTEAILNSSVSQLTDANDLINSVSTLVQQGIQSTDKADAEALALEAEGILGQLQSLANTQFNGEFIYAGSRTNREPFEFSAPQILGRSLTVDYLGSNTNGEVRISDRIFVDNYYNGLDIFGRGQREPTVLIGSTGAQTGTGTDTVESRAYLDVTQGSIDIAGTSGVTLSNQLENDSLIGQFQVTLVDTSGTGASGTISINGSDPITFDNTQTNLPVSTPDGQTIYLDTTAITPGYSGTFDIVANGFLSIDGGVTQTAIDFSNNQTVSDAAGEFVTIDSSSITRTGTDYLEFPGTSDAFQVIQNAISDLRQSRNLSNTQLAESFDRILGELEDVRDRFLGAIGQQATSLRTLENVGLRKDQQSIELQIQASDIQGTDFSQAALELTNAQALLEYSFAVTAQINSVNILDFLR